MAHAFELLAPSQYTYALRRHAAKHLRTMSSHYKLYHREGFLQIQQYRLLPQRMQMHFHLINQYKPWSLGYRILTQLRIQTRHAIGQVSHHADNTAEAVAQFIYHHFTHIGMTDNKAFQAIIIIQITQAGTFQTHVDSVLNRILQHHIALHLGAVLLL